MTNSNTGIEAFKDVLASIVGSVACVYTGQPFDTIKVRMQAQPGLFDGPINCIRKTLKNESIFSLWRGSTPAVIGALSENAAAFGVNGALKRIFKENEKKEKSYLEPFLTGGITGFVTAFVLCPSDVVKCRAQLSRAQGFDMTAKEVALDLYRKNGLKGLLFTGIGAQILRDIPFYSSFFGSYDIMCMLMKKYTAWPDSSIYFIAGGFAGQIGWIVSIAPDTIKSQIQTSAKPLGIIETGSIIMRERGLLGMFAGANVAIIRAFPANAALFLGYEIARDLMR